MVVPLCIVYDLIDSNLIFDLFSPNKGVTASCERVATAAKKKPMAPTTTTKKRWKVSKKDAVVPTSPRHSRAAISDSDVSAGASKGGDIAVSDNDSGKHASRQQDGSRWGPTAARTSLLVAYVAVFIAARLKLQGGPAPVWYGPTNAAANADSFVTRVLSFAYVQVYVVLPHRFWHALIRVLLIVPFVYWHERKPSHVASRDGIVPVPCKGSQR
jgi:hypothetical protein